MIKFFLILLKLIFFNIKIEYQLHIHNINSNHNDLNKRRFSPFSINNENDRANVEQEIHE